MQGWLLAVSGGFFALGWIFAMVRQHLLLRAAARAPQRMAEAIEKIRSGRRLEAANFLLESEYSPGGTAALHLVAASLLREQGEYGRAIRIHKQLREAAAADDIDARARATYELGLDYFMAGFLDLAEECFEQLADSGYADRAMERLLFIHLRTRSWAAAVDAYRKMEKARPDLEAPRSILAHLYCEWACEFDSAAGERVEKLDAALQAWPQSVRALLLRGDCALAAGDAGGACEYWNRARWQPGLLFMLPDRILSAHESTGSRDEGLSQVRQLLADHPSPALLSSACRAVRTRFGDAALTPLVDAALAAGGTDAVREWLAARVRSGAEGREEYERLHEALPGAGKRFRCSQCSYRSSHHSWQCPQCLAWDSVEQAAAAAE